MLKTLKEIFATQQVERPDGGFEKLHSNTTELQGLFLQEIFDLVKPVSSLEVGLAFGISSMFILEKHALQNSAPKAHLIIEPYPWGGVAEHNFKKEGIEYLAEIVYEKSDLVLPKLYMEKKRIQYAYIDTTKLFDTVMQDIYFIDKLMDVDGVIILDDCGGGWPGIQKAARFLNSLPHYDFLKGHNQNPSSIKRTIASSITAFFLQIIPFKKRFIQGFNFKTNLQLNLEYRCIAFKKNAEDSRKWDWDSPL